MFTHLLVPLDGSSLAEATLPYVRALATLDAPRVTLLHLIEPSPPASVHGARHLRTVAEAEQYLTDVARILARDGIAVETHVDTNEAGDTAGRIVDHAAEWAADLVVLCAHGRNGIGRWLFGSIAQKVMADGVAPVLLVRPVAGSEPRPVAFRNLLVPLDGTADSEHVLPVARDLARAAGGVLHLAMVVPTVETLSGAMSSVARFSPKVTTELLHASEQDAVAYLASLVQRLAVDGVAVRATVGRGEPAAVTVETAKRLRADLVLIASHGRAGWEGAWAGSVSNKILARLDSPFVLVRAPGKPQTVA